VTGMSVSAICSTCGVNVEYPENRTGETVKCPACKGGLVLVAETPMHGDFVRLDDPPEQSAVVGQAIVGQAQNVFIGSPSPTPPERVSGREKHRSGALMAIGVIFVLIALSMIPVWEGVIILGLIGGGFIYCFKWRCAECKQDIHPEATTCPHCTLRISR
jgi:DNA-directed RNA polymerase subunit RPC12/RpoP